MLEASIVKISNEEMAQLAPITCSVLYVGGKTPDGGNPRNLLGTDENLIPHTRLQWDSNLDPRNERQKEFTEPTHWYCKTVYTVLIDFFSYSPQYSQHAVSRSPLPSGQASISGHLRPWTDNHRLCRYISRSKNHQIRLHSERLGPCPRCILLFIANFADSSRRSPSYSSFDG